MAKELAGLIDPWLAAAILAASGVGPVLPLFRLARTVGARAALPLS